MTQDRPAQPLLSIIIPAYNEAKTVATLLDRVLAHQVAGLDREIIIVESNSDDGTRAIVAGYESHTAVTCIWQDRPRGKGHAVRTGLTRARGDIVLIQDADLEYDVRDYEALLSPILSGRTAFVLGSRHTSGRQIREFVETPALAAFMNLGHIFLRGVVNTLSGQRVKDPFTMYKVFRRDCLLGMHLVCDRFDFDIELFIKLVRNGYVPEEVPVSYRSRSFGDGKKIVIWRDPFTWIWAAFTSRFGRL